ncbi:MAG: STAS-like domain-containing protein [Deltaproteobacteria bacterium]|nr:STAS-like domain-containing protein [Deltaproteobacteria bacterium]
MKITLVKFGDLLISRPAGREAALVVQAYFQPATPDEPIELDFTGVQVVAPSWLDEFLQGLRRQFGNRVHCLPSNNPTVIESLAVMQ